MLFLGAVYRRVTDLFFAVRDGMLYCAFEGLDSAYSYAITLRGHYGRYRKVRSNGRFSSHLLARDGLRAKPVIEECVGEEWDFEVEPQLRESRRWIERELAHLGEPYSRHGAIEFPTIHDLLTLFDSYIERVLL